MSIRRVPWPVWLFLGALLIFILLALYARAGEKPTHKPRAKWHLVVRVVDGDTLVLENKERVRLIGVDTPETKHPRKPVEYYGKEATAFTNLTRLLGERVLRLLFCFNSFSIRGTSCS